jgi:hypothetical protein
MPSAPSTLGPPTNATRVTHKCTFSDRDTSTPAARTSCCRRHGRPGARGPDQTADPAQWRDWLATVEATRGG